jgi:hypothetical protein
MTIAPARERTVLDDAREQLAQAVEVFGLWPEVHAMLAAPRRELSVCIPLQHGEGSVEVLRGYRLQHNYSRSAARALSVSTPGLASTKCGRSRCGRRGNVLNLPYGGAKGGVQVVRARPAVEGSNGPLTPEADPVLAERGTLVAPDILVTPVERSFLLRVGPGQPVVLVDQRGGEPAPRRADGPRLATSPMPSTTSLPCASPRPAWWSSLSTKPTK